MATPRNRNRWVRLVIWDSNVRLYGAPGACVPGMLLGVYKTVHSYSVASAFRRKPRDLPVYCSSTYSFRSTIRIAQASDRTVIVIKTNRLSGADGDSEKTDWSSDDTLSSAGMACGTSACR